MNLILVEVYLIIKEEVMLDIFLLIKIVVLGALILGFI